MIARMVGVIQRIHSRTLKRRPVGVAIIRGYVAAYRADSAGAPAVFAAGPLSTPAEYAAALEAALEQVLAGRRRWPGFELVVALDLEVVQVKELFGFPATEDARAGSQMLRENASTFFRRLSPVLLTSNVSIRSDGRPHAAAFRGDVIQALVGVASARGASTVLAVSATQFRVESVPAVDDVPLLASEIAVEAAHLKGGDSRSALGLRVKAEPPPLPRVRSVAATAAVTVSLAALVVLPQTWPRVALRSLNEQHAAFGAEERRLRQVAVELREVSEAVTELSSRRAEARSSIEVIAQIARSLPEGGAISRLSIDSSGVGLVALVPRAEDLLRGLTEQADILDPSLVGPVMPELIDSRDLERVSVRYRVRAASDTSLRPPE